MWPDDWYQALYSYPIFGVAFLCHFNALPVHSELSQPTASNSRFVVTVTMTLAGMVSLSLSLSLSLTLSLSLAGMVT